jgi:CCR4-NOT transcription complex subunit 1
MRTIIHFSDMNDNSESAALAKAVREAGPSCCKNASTVNEVLSQAGYDSPRTPSEQDIARILGEMVSRQSKANPDNAWDFKAFATVLNKNPVDWVKVIHALDYPGFKISDVSGLEFIISAFRNADKVHNAELFSRHSLRMSIARYHC